MTCIIADYKDIIIAFLTINTSSYSGNLLVMNDNNTMTDTTEQILASENEAKTNKIFAIDNTEIANSLISDYNYEPVQ